MTLYNIIIYLLFIILLLSIPIRVSAVEYSGGMPAMKLKAPEIPFKMIEFLLFSTYRYDVINNNILSPVIALLTSYKTIGNIKSVYITYFTKVSGVQQTDKQTLHNLNNDNIGKYLLIISVINNSTFEMLGYPCNITDEFGITNNNMKIFYMDNGTITV